MVSYCTSDYGLLSAEKLQFGPGWSSNQTAVSLSAASFSPNILKAFSYQDSSVYNNYPYVGTYSTYYGGGYVYELLGASNQTDLTNDFDSLEQNMWIDRQTRAILLEFPLFNPHVSLFAYCSVLFEILPSGTIIKSARFSTMNLLSFSASMASFSIMCAVIYLCVVFVMFCNEIRKIYKLKKQYFTEFWSYIDWMIIAFSWAAFSIYLYRLWATDSALDTFKSLSKTGQARKYVNLQNVANWNEVLDILFGFLCAISTIKFFQVLEFSKTISLLSKTLKRAGPEIFNFMFIFLIAWMAFVQVMYLIFSEKLPQFRTIPKTMSAAFQNLLGKFDVMSLVKVTI